ncbi:DNA primase [Natronosporangium hydrolyticum]|uniref:DNA primase n=1 Tax=Natronosporangium hydrolyticum TaxID=2811111 RepID=A0A895YMA0_9ACTN|nr:DNA primase [Natronosporangium hydrolyticum]
MTDSPDAVADSPDDVPADDQTAARSAETDELWSELRVEPVKVALPGGDVGYTLRAYRPASELTPTEVPDAEVDEDDPFAARERARAQEEAELAEAAEAAALAGVVADSDTEPDDEAAESEELEADEEPEESDEEEAAAADEEELPVFLSHRGRLLLFRTPESLVSFITSDAPHDLAQLDTWPSVVKRVKAAHVAPTDDDTYELDLVVENLRGGHDAWDIPLLVSAGEFARDVGFALRLTPVITALSPGSPLDDLDEALRATAGGGFGSLFARRRLRRVGAQQASLGWRTVIGKIVAAVDWHD